MHLNEEMSKKMTEEKQLTNGFAMPSMPGNEKGNFPSNTSTLKCMWFRFVSNEMDNSDTVQIKVARKMQSPNELHRAASKKAQMTRT